MDDRKRALALVIAWVTLVIDGVEAEPVVVDGELVGLQLVIPVPELRLESSGKAPELRGTDGNVRSPDDVPESGDHGTLAGP